MFEEKFFLTQIKRTNGTYEKGVVVKNNLEDAKQAYHAYFGAYGYNHDANTDYVQCLIYDINGTIVFGPEVDNRIPAPEE
jgi:hypothetical protein